MVYTRGGVWTNVEDEILRVAITKYGLNQWARVSSLLARKTAKQAKARWNEWLDPSIKKTEWSREEDEKLLHLAKLMPTQWRSIAPIVGRTANQCIERYQQLLDEADQIDKNKSDLSLNGVDDGSYGAATSLRIGDIDHAPETKPAKPDAIDMDDDEKEMLAEARARLANTQGKKAKRKDRERLLDESRRLALLQKRRELKQAGINTKLHKKNKTGMDYNSDIPLEHRPAAGFYDTSVEHEQNLREKQKFERNVKRNVNDSRDDSSVLKRDHDSQKSKISEAQASSMQSEMVQKMDVMEQISKRRRLELPEPQVRDDEIERIVKSTRQGDISQGRFDPDKVIHTEATPVKSFATPLPPARSSTSVSDAVRGLKALTNVQSALLNVVHEEEPGRGDTDKENDGIDREHYETSSVPIESEKPIVSHKDMRALLREKLSMLPEPQNEIEVIMPEESESRVEAMDIDTLPEDEGEREKLIAAKLEQERQIKLEQRSSVLRKGLPRPQVAAKDLVALVSDADPNSPWNLIQKETVKLITSDMIKYPIDGFSITKGEILDDLSIELRDQIHGIISLESEQLQKKADGNESNSSEKLHHSAESLLEALQSSAKSANKQEKKLSLTMGGYAKREATLISKMDEATSAYNNSHIQNTVFKQLLELEESAASSRIAKLGEEVDVVVRKERESQARHDELSLVAASLG